MPWIFDHRGLVVGAFAVVVGVVLVAATQPSTQADTTRVERESAAARTSAKTTVALRPAKAAGLDAMTAAEVKSHAPAAATPAPEAAAEDVASVTVTGCLELDDQTFRLKDASGADAPAARSWKSGFFKKRRPSVEIVDGTKTLRLRNYVGQRVAATGTFAQGELAARSVRRIAASCT